MAEQDTAGGWQGEWQSVRRRSPPRLTADTIAGMSEGKRNSRLLIGAMVAVPLAIRN